MPVVVVEAAVALVVLVVMIVCAVVITAINLLILFTASRGRINLPPLAELTLLMWTEAPTLRKRIRTRTKDRRWWCLGGDRRAIIQSSTQKVN